MSAVVGVVVEEEEEACRLGKGRRRHVCGRGWTCRRARRTDLDGINEPDIFASIASIGFYAALSPIRST